MTTPGADFPSSILSQHGKAPRTLLLVDDEQSILSSLNRLLRQDKYQILTADGGQEALEILASTPVDVIVSDQRMPGMTGVDFLRIAKASYPDTVRIVLSGYTELQSVTDAINEGAIYKFLTKPWDDVQLRTHIAEAFHRKELSDDNDRLNEALRVANTALAKSNMQLDKLLKEKDAQIKEDGISLDIVHEILQFLPLPVIGLDENDMVVMLNAAAGVLVEGGPSLLGEYLSKAIPALARVLLHPDQTQRHCIDLAGRRFDVSVMSMGQASLSRGKLVTLLRFDNRNGLL